MGCWNEQQLYVLKDCYESYLEVRLRIQKCDDKMESCFLQIIESQGEESNEPMILKKKQRSRNSLGYNVSKIGYQLYGVDLMEIECVSEATVNSLICEIGRDIYKFSTAKKFVSWLRLAPNNKISGGKVISSKTPKSVNRFTLTLRNAANTIGNLKSGYLNYCFKKLAFNKGRGAAITAIARKLAVIIWKMITLKQSYHPYEKELETEKQKVKIIKQLKSKIKQMNINPIELGFDFQVIATS